MPKHSQSFSDSRSVSEVLASLKLACVAHGFEVVEAGNELLAKKGMGLSSWPITLSIKVAEGGEQGSSKIDLFGEIGGVGPIQASHLKKSIAKILARAGLSSAPINQPSSVEAGSVQQEGELAVMPASLQVPLSEKPLGFILAVLGGLPAAPVGIFASAGALFLLAKALKKSSGKPSPNRFAWWAAIGIIGLPLSFGINAAIFPGIYEASKNASSTSSVPNTSAPTTPAPAPVLAAWDSPQSKAELEQSLVENWANAFTGVEQSVKSAECKPSSPKNFWTCSVRFLGVEEPSAYKVEVDENTGQWAAQPIL